MKKKSGAGSGAHAMVQMAQWLMRPAT